MKTIALIIIFLSFRFTTNAQWFWQNPSPTGNWLADVQLISSQVGWAVGESGTLLKTVDGGTNWINKSISSNLDLRGINFIDDSHGIIVGWNSIIKTTDAGKSWSVNQSTGLYLDDVQFIDVNIGYAVGVYGIYKTTDGGSELDFSRRLCN